MRRVTLVCRKRHRGGRTPGLSCPARAWWKQLQPLCAVLGRGEKSRDTLQYPPHRAETQQRGPTGTARSSYFIGTPQTRNQYEKAIVPTKNRTEHQFNRIKSTCWFG